MKRQPKPDSESYSIRLKKELVKLIREKAKSEERTLHNMMTVLIKRGLENNG